MEQDFDAFYELVAPSVQRLALVLTGDEYEAGDLAQAAFERLFVRWGRLSISEPIAYARAVVVRVHASRGRRGFRVWERVTESMPERQEQDPTNSLGESLGLVAALAALPLRQRQAVVLRYLEDLPISEVSHLMGCTEGAVKRSSHDGLRTLRQVLGERAER